MAQGGVRLSAATFELIWQYLRLGEMPTALYVPPKGATVADRQAAGRAAIDELAEQDLLVGRDDLDEEVAALFRLLARPTDEFYGWFVRADGSAFSGLVGVHQRRAAIAILDNGRAWVAPVAPTTPAQALIGIAPRGRPVTAKSITVPADKFTAPTEPARRHSDFEAARGVLADSIPESRDSAVNRLRALVAEPDRGRAQLFVALRDRAGRRRKSARPIYYLDTEAGRWMLHFSSRHGGEPWLTAAAGSAEALTHALYDTRRELLDSR
ncbi:MAG TPA: ESX secretion-associated protein EspG [Pseudonocardiaceae bacterium]|jgi:hypothetical protein|nr:ESX secretion-associated protein EspG [Pseudonocardiaceae bacterium]